MSEALHRRFWENDLYNLLASRISNCRTGRGLFDVAGYAKRMEMTPEGLYKYLRSDRLTVDGARRIIAASGGKITEQDMLPFVFR